MPFTRPDLPEATPPATAFDAWLRELRDAGVDTDRMIADLTVIWDHLRFDPEWAFRPGHRYDAVIVLGSPDIGSAAFAANFLGENDLGDIPIVFSGWAGMKNKAGTADEEWFEEVATGLGINSEAKTFRVAAERLGLNSARNIIEEPHARNTRGNAENSVPLLWQAGYKTNSLLVICAPPHARRAHSTFMKKIPEVIERFELAGELPEFMAGIPAEAQHVAVVTAGVSLSHYLRYGPMPENPRTLTSAIATEVRGLIETPVLGHITAQEIPERVRNAYQHVAGVLELVRIGSTRAELEVFTRIVHGTSNKDIAAELGTTLWEVRKHATSIYAKFGVSGRDELEAAIRARHAADTARKAAAPAASRSASDNDPVAIDLGDSDEYALTPSARRALERAEDEAAEVVAETLRGAEQLGFDTTHLHRRDTEQITRGIAELKDTQARRLDAVLRRRVLDRLAVKVLTDDRALLAVNDRFVEMQRQIAAWHRYVDEVRVALAVLAAEDILAAAGARKLGSGVGLVHGKDGTMRIVVASPLRGQQSLLDRADPLLREMADNDGIPIDHWHVQVGRDGRVSVETVSGVHDRLESALKYYDDPDEIAWMKDLVDERSFAEKLAEAEASGVAERKRLKGDSNDPTMSEQVVLITYRNGFRAIEKTVRDLDQADAEELGSLISRICGVAAPPTLRRDEGGLTLLMAYAPGVVDNPTDEYAELRFRHTPVWRRLLLAEQLLRTWDRFEGANLGVDHEVRLVPIDFSNSFHHPDLDPPMAALYKDALEFPPGELESIRAGIDEAEAVFESMNRRDTWYGDIVRIFTKFRNQESTEETPDTLADILDLLEHLRDDLAHRFEARPEQDNPQAWRAVVAELRETYSHQRDRSMLAYVDMLDGLIKLHLDGQLLQVRADELHDDYGPDLLNAYVDGLMQRVADVADSANYPMPNGESDAEWQERFDREIARTANPEAASPENAGPTDPVAIDLADDEQATPESSSPARPRTIMEPGAEHTEPGPEYWEPVRAAIAELLEISPEGFAYLRDLPLPRDGAPFGDDWFSNRRAWFRAIFHGNAEALRDAELTDKDLLELSRIFQRFPLYAMLTLVNVTGASIDHLVHERRVDWRTIFFTQTKITRQVEKTTPEGETVLVDETIPVWKIRTKPVGTPEQASSRDNDDVTRFGEWQRRTSQDELPQVPLIAAGVMEYFTGRPMLNPDIDLMTDACRRGVITEDELAHWKRFQKNDLWSAGFFPGCRWLEAQSDEYLRARALCAVIWSRAGSRAAEEYLMAVTDKYLASTVLRESAEFVLGTANDIAESLANLLPGRAATTVLDVSRYVLASLTGTFQGMVELAADQIYPSPATQGSRAEPAAIFLDDSDEPEAQGEWANPPRAWDTQPAARTTDTRWDMFPDEAAAAAIRDLPEDAGDLDPDLTLDIHPFFASDGVKTEEDVDTVAAAVGDMMRERGWRDPGQIDAAAELVRTAGRNAVTYMTSYTDALQQQGSSRIDGANLLDGMRARLVLRMTTHAGHRSLQVAVMVDQHRPRRVATLESSTWPAPLFSHEHIGTDIRAALDSATRSGVEQWGEVWARFDEPRSGEIDSADTESRPTGELHAKARIARKLYDDHHIRMLGWDIAVVPLAAVESVDRTLRALIAEYGGCFALRFIGFREVPEDYGATESFGITSSEFQDHYTTITISTRIFTDPAAPQRWADRVANHHYAKSDQDIVSQATYHEFLHAVAGNSDWILHDQAPAALLAAYRLFLASGLLPGSPSFDEWLTQLPGYAFVDGNPDTATIDPKEGLVEGATAGALESSLPLTHPARILHWLMVTRDESSPAEILARWARQDPGSGELQPLLQEFQEVSGRTGITAPAGRTDTIGDTLAAATGGQLTVFADSDQVDDRLRAWGRSMGDGGNGVMAFVVQEDLAGRARACLLVRRVDGDGRDRVEVRDPAAGLLRANRVRSPESPGERGVRAIFFDSTGTPVSIDSGPVAPIPSGR
ncbi:ElyC/SanA/YdcF family protein [Nocardia blacklockiae]|uniref:ElyC/SanA/YdcF family protein n=1 Tax=Nocardia blacklockiae TaxID=480036 RepID=UPI001892EA48|nr:ElyC/SanA/YdcF family protein [Nocardia blacklockiae]MBF6174731.1 YdcF family protein [Nocardia blacklockiae]